MKINDKGESGGNEVQHRKARRKRSKKPVRYIRNGKIKGNGQGDNEEIENSSNRHSPDGKVNGNQQEV